MVVSLKSHKYQVFYRTFNIAIDLQYNSANFSVDDGVKLLNFKTSYT